MAIDGTSSLPDDIRESIAIGNVKSVAEQSSMLSNLAYANLISNVNLSQQNAVSNQQAMNQLGLTVTGKVVNLVANLSPMEAVAVVKMDTGNDIAQQLSDIKGTLASFAPTP
ncbi:MAG TPA: R body protein [Blastocatellia bacterium]|nr:R body protein [Blastocatellia bacterium]